MKRFATRSLGETEESVPGSHRAKLLTYFHLFLSANDGSILRSICHKITKSEPYSLNKKLMNFCF